MIATLYVDHTVRIGTRYRQAGQSYGIWKVVSITRDHAGNPHAKLALERDHTRLVTIAFSALSDSSLYEIVISDVEEPHGSTSL